MYGKSLLVGAALLPGLAVAGHAKEDWPEPVKEYYTGQVLFDRLELTRTNEEENLAVWDMIAWYGGDYHRAVFKSEGENVQDDGERNDALPLDVSALASPLPRAYEFLDGSAYLPHVERVRR